VDEDGKGRGVVYPQPELGVLGKTVGGGGAVYCGGGGEDTCQGHHR